MLSDEDRLRVYGGRDGVDAVDRMIDAGVAAMPALSAGQRDALRVLLGGGVRIPVTAGAGVCLGASPLVSPLEAAVS